MAMNEFGLFFLPYSNDISRRVVPKCYFITYFLGPISTIVSAVL